jgi:hypothetical protein
MENLIQRAVAILSVASATVHDVRNAMANEAPGDVALAIAGARILIRDGFISDVTNAGATVDSCGRFGAMVLATRRCSTRRIAEIASRFGYEAIRRDGFVAVSFPD